MAKEYLTTTEAAEILGFADISRIRQLLLAGDLAGKKQGRDWLVEKQSVLRLKRERAKGKKK